MPIQIKKVADPVVFTNNADIAGAAPSIQVPEKGEATLQLHAGGGKVQAAWYSPHDHISDLPKINRIVCNPNGEHVDLVVAGLPHHADAVVRIRVYAAVEV